MLLKALGAVDIISAAIIIFSAYNIHWVITAVHAAILIAKGSPSLLTDAAGIVYGLTDITAAVFIIFAIPDLLPAKIIIFLILTAKGALSLI